MIIYLFLSTFEIVNSFQYLFKNCVKITINKSPVSKIHGPLGLISNNFVVKLHGAQLKYGSVLGCCDPNTNVHYDNEHTYILILKLRVLHLHMCIIM